MSLLDSHTFPKDIKKMNIAQLEQLADEIRRFIIDTVSKTGGHLAPSLGVVELTISLLRFFDPGDDRIIWDVGHQSYAYKILTERKDRFHTLRQFKGLSGFNKPVESRFDAFGVGHTSTSISAGLGIKVADDMLGKDRKVVSIIGDGAMTAGLAFEGLNNLGHFDKNMIVVLNDNEMSISPNVGGFSSYLSNLMSGKLYTKMRKDIQYLLERRPLGKPLLNLAKKFEEGLFQMFTPGILFEELGLRYIGPVNGHNLKDLEKAFENSLNVDGPVLIHVSTKKGKGYQPAEDNPASFHGVSSFDVETGKAKKFGTAKTYNNIIGETLCEMAKTDERVVAITAAMKTGTGLDYFENSYPDRLFDVGIAEQHAVTFAAGLAIEGVRPFVAIYSTFLQRAFDQIVHDVALQKLDVVFCIDRAGLVGADGPTHHGIFDISYMKCVPNLTIMLPKGGWEVAEMLKLAKDMGGPCAIRFPRGTAKTYPELEEQPIQVGKPEVIYNEGDIAIVSAGHIFEEAYRLWQLLNEKGKKAALVNLRFLKPLHEDALMEVLKDKKLIITVEEGSVKGGAGEEIQSVVMDSGNLIRVVKYGVPDKFIEHGSVDELRDLIGLTGEKIYEDLKIRFLI